MTGEDCITLCLENGWEQTSLWQNADGDLIDTDGNTLTPVEYIMLLPTPEDELNQTACFSDDFQDVSIDYPIQLSAGPHSNVHNAVTFNAVMEDGTDDYYANILMAFQPISGYAPYMKKGAATAEKYMNDMINDFINTMCGDYVLKVLDDFDFRDNGNNYSIACDLWYDGSFFGDDLSQPVRGHVEVRYYGPTGYALVIMTTALESRLQNYVDICNNMLTTLSYDAGWRTPN